MKKGQPTKSHKNKKVQVTRAQLTMVKEEAISQTMILMVAYLMDDVGFDKQACLDFWDGLTRYAAGVEDKLLTMQQICDIINEHTGLGVRWSGCRRSLI